MQLYYVHEINGDRAKGDENEARHLSKVMRKSVGDLAYVTAGDGKLWQAEILQLGRSNVLFKLLRVVKTLTDEYKMGIAVAPTKSASRIEDLLEKGVELGLTDLHLVHSERTLRKEFKTKRLFRLAISAMKQCLRLNKTRIHEMEAYRDFLKSAAGKYKYKYIGKIEGDNAYLINEKADGDVLVMIGPEGDFTDEEYKLAEAVGFKYIKLSEQRLRTETASILAIATVQDKRQLDEK